MSLPPVGASLVLENDAQFKRSLSEINAGMSVSRAEMRLAEAQSKTMSDSQEGLRKKINATEDVLASQKDKIAELTKAYENSVRREGEGSKTTMKWKAALVSAQAAAVKTTSTIDAYKKQLDLTNSVGYKLSTGIQELSQKFGITLPSGAKKALDVLQGLVSPAALVTAGLTALGAAAVKAYQGLADQARESAAWADDLNTTAAQLGITSRELQEFEYASNLVDVSTETLSSSFAKLRVKVGEGDESLKNLAKASHTVIDTTQGTMQTFEQCLDALGKVTDENERAALAQDIFGRSYSDLAPLINAGSAALEGYMQEAEACGAVLSEEQTAKLNALNDTYDRTNAQMEAIKNKLGAEVTPAFQLLADVWAEFMPELNEFIENYGPGINAVVSVVTGGLSVLVELLRGLLWLLNSAADAVEAFGRHLDYLAAKAAGLNTTLTETFNLGNGVTKVYQTNMYTGKRVEVTGSQYAAGTRSAVEGWALVGERGPELMRMAGGEQVLSTAASQQALGGDTIYLTLQVNMDEVSDIARLVEIARNYAVTVRKGAR